MLHTIDKITKKDLDERLMSPWWSLEEKEEAKAERDRRLDSLNNLAECEEICIVTRR